MPLQRNLAGKSNEVSLHGHLLSFATLFQDLCKNLFGFAVADQALFMDCQSEAILREKAEESTRYSDQHADKALHMTTQHQIQSYTTELDQCTQRRTIHNNKRYEDKLLKANQLLML